MAQTLQGKKSLSKRNSSIELLKIFGILLIIVSHIVQTLVDKNNYVGYSDYVVNLRVYVPGFDYYMLALLRHGGIVGNSLFFICSAWYLTDSNKNNIQKLFQMILDVYIISMCWLIFTKIDMPVDKLDTTLIVRSFFPISFSNNWYVTAYILFCLIHISLNKYIRTLERREHFRINLVLFTLFIALTFPVYFVSKSYAYQGSNVFLWITLYFIISYLKKYELNLMNSRALNIALSVIGIAGIVIMLSITRHAAIDGEFARLRVLNWNTNANPFALMLCVGLFNLARTNEFRCKPIDYISSVSLLIYVIHENELCRDYYRPYFWKLVYDKGGYDHILLWCFVQVICFFAVSLTIATIYKFTIQRLTSALSKWLMPQLTKLYLALENKIYK